MGKEVPLYDLRVSHLLKNVAIFWDIAPRSPYVNRRFGGMYQDLKPAGKKLACSR
jgi:hypothetical protein